MLETMGSGVTIQIQGLDQLRKQLGKIPPIMRKEIEAEMSAVGTGFVNRAQADAPWDNRALANAITMKKTAPMEFEIVSPAPYSAFVEFGTKKRAKVPPEYAAYASQFKQSGGGGGKEFYNNILAWVKRKGITGTYSVKTKRREGGKIDNQIEDEQTAFAIWLSILRHGIKPHPFFLKQIPIAQKELNQQMEAMIKRVFA